MDTRLEEEDRDNVLCVSTHIRKMKTELIN